MKKIVKKSLGSGTPFSDDFVGCSWNAQSLFCECKLKVNRKRLKVTQLLNKRDFFCIQETFATKGCETALKLPVGTTSFWSHLVDRTRKNPIPIDTKEKMDKGREVLLSLLRKNSWPNSIAILGKRWLKAKSRFFTFWVTPARSTSGVFTFLPVVPKNALNAFRAVLCICYLLTNAFL